MSTAAVERWRVFRGGVSGPYIMARFERLPELQRILDKHKVQYEVEGDVISINGGPEMVAIHPKRGVGFETLQSILDHTVDTGLESQSVGEVPQREGDRRMSTSTSEQLQVAVMDGGRGFIRVRYDRLVELQQLLDKHGIPYVVLDNTVSFDGGPEMALVVLGRGVDVDAVQSVLDHDR